MKLFAGTIKAKSGETRRVLAWSGNAQLVEAIQGKLLRECGGKMIRKSIPEIEERVARLAVYFDAQPDGTECSWEQIETDTTISMNQHGRTLVRRALRKLKRPYEAVRGIGLILSSPRNAMTIVGNRFVRIDNAVRGADRTRKEIATRHLDALEERDKQRMRVLAGFFGAVRTFANEAKMKILPQAK